MDTAAVQRAIDAVAKEGGTLRFGPGTYYCGSLHLRSHVTLVLEAGATIKGSTDIKNYDPYETLNYKNDADEETTFFHSALIWGEDVENIAITGQGTIDGNWDHRHGPKGIALKRCRDVQITGVRVMNTPNYAISMLGTDFVNIDGVTILNSYADGIDPDACRNVCISNCHVESHDDAIVPKSSFALGEHRSTENITVTNCYLATDCNAFKLGTESGGDFKRIAVSNCVMDSKGENRRAQCGIGLESVDGSNLDGVVISNITMVRVEAPLLIRLGNRGRDMATPTAGTLKNVLISNVVATGATITNSVTGIPGHNLEGVQLSNIRIVYDTIPTLLAAGAAVPEAIANYPKVSMFGALPAYGLYCRHANDMVLNNVQIFVDDSAVKANPSAENKAIGHAFVFDDVHDLQIDSIKATPSVDGASVLHFSGLSDVLIRGCVAPKGTGVFLELAGVESDGITLISNDLTGAKTAVAGPFAKKGVNLIANRIK